MKFYGLLISLIGLWSAPVLWAADMVLIDPAQIEGGAAYSDVKPFLMDRTEVTVGELIKFRQETRFKDVPQYQHKFPKERRTPANLVDWFEAAQFCQNLGKRLPSAREWTLAAGPTRLYAWGDSAPDGSQANICDKRCKTPWHLWRVDDGHERESVVGSYPQGATPEGLLDMTGNLWEWTHTRARDGQPLIFRGDDQPREDLYAEMVIKGGSYGSTPQQLKNQEQAPSPATYKASYLGFRCVKEVP
ncbi:MAG: formylglycine-generating enzyme family protein [bacterium]|nr:formylglycine-generating enzyme family protein [bacterium]